MMAEILSGSGLSVSFDLAKPTGAGQTGLVSLNRIMSGQWPLPDSFFRRLSRNGTTPDKYSQGKLQVFCWFTLPARPVCVDGKEANIQSNKDVAKTQRADPPKGGYSFPNYWR